MVFLVLYLVLSLWAGDFYAVPITVAFTMACNESMATGKPVKVEHHAEGESSSGTGEGGQSGSRRRRSRYRGRPKSKPGGENKES